LVPRDQVLPLVACAFSGGFADILAASADTGGATALVEVVNAQLRRSGLEIVRGTAELMTGRRRFETRDEAGRLVAVIDVLPTEAADGERRTLELSADVPGVSVRVAIFHPAVELRRSPGSQRPDRRNRAGKRPKRGYLK
jgi:hypothetical protein